MTAFLESPRFPDAIRYGVTGGAQYSTTIITVGSGAEQRNRNWSQPRGQWTLDHGPHDKTSTDTLIAFFRAVGGRATGFRFRDWTDFEVTAANGIVVALADGRLQLAKQYVMGSITEIRLISKPVPGTVVLPGGGSVDTATGIVTGSSAGAVWSGQFDVPARFDVDSLAMQAVTSGLYEWGQVPIVEIRV